MVKSLIENTAAKTAPARQSAGRPDVVMLDPAAFLQHLKVVVRASPATIKAYASDINQFVAWFQERVGQLSLEQFTRQTLFGFMASLDGLSPNSVRRKVHALGSWFGYLLECGVLQHNPAYRLPLPRRERSLPRYPSDEQVRAVMAACRRPVEKAAVWVLSTTGVRRAELLGLDLADCDLDGRQIRVLGKGNKERLIPLPTATVEVLIQYLHARGDAAGPLLVNRAGERMGPTSLRRLLQRVMRRAGLGDEQFSTHSFRHAYCTSLIRSGADIAVVRDLAGHSDAAVTSAYLHSDTSSRKAAVERLPIVAIGGEGND